MVAHCSFRRITAAQLGDYAAALAVLGRGSARRPDLTGDLTAGLAQVLALAGDTAAAKRALVRAEHERTRPLNVALAWAACGDRRRALDWLEREPACYWDSVQVLRWDPRLEPLRATDRFAAYASGVFARWRTVESE